MTRTGKIARLPREIRERLNRRLQDGESGRQLIEWLNSLPEAQAVLDRDFDGRHINDQNLSDWKQGGYRDWLVQEEALSQAGELAANAEELTEVSQGRMADHLATVLTARYAAVLAAWNDEEGDELTRKLRPLRDLCHNVVELRRGEHYAARLKIEQTLLERSQEKTDEDLIEYILKWIEYPKVRDCICAEASSPNERRERLRELLGLGRPAPSEAAAAAEIQGNSR
jgi:hypothetical protein